MMGDCRQYYYSYYSYYYPYYYYYYYVSSKGALAGCHHFSLLVFRRHPCARWGSFQARSSGGGRS